MLSDLQETKLPVEGMTKRLVLTPTLLKALTWKTYVCPGDSSVIMQSVSFPLYDCCQLEFGLFISTSNSVSGAPPSYSG